MLKTGCSRKYGHMYDYEDSFKDVNYFTFIYMK